MNRTVSILLWLIGEAILIASFMYFGMNDKQIHLIVNLCVSTIILTVIMMSLFKNTDVLVKRGVGNNMKWFFTLTYSLLSIGTMLYFEFANPVDLLTQIIVQVIFLAVLFMGMWGAFKPAKKSETDGKYLKMEQNQLIMIRNVIGVARARAEKRVDIPASILNGIINLQEEAHQIVPANEYVALKMEGRIMLEMNQIIQCLKEPLLDLKRMQYVLKSCSKLITEYRGTYSMPQAHQLS